MSTDRIKDFGTVKFWRDSYGFIAPDGGNHTDVFCHISHVTPGLQPRKGARVSFHLAPDRRRADRVMAVDVTVLAT